LEGALSNHVRYVLQKETAYIWIAWIHEDTWHTAMVMGEQMFTHLRPPHARAAHLAEKNLLLPLTQTFLNFLLLGLFLRPLIIQRDLIVQFVLEI